MLIVYQMQISPQRGRTLMSYPAGGNFLRLHCGVKQWVYTSVATKLCCTVALLCGAVLLCYCSSPVLDLQHELLRRIEEKASRFSAGRMSNHGVDPRGDTAGMCATWLPWPFSRTYLHRRAWRSRRFQIVGRILIRSTTRSSLVWSSVCSVP